MTASGSSQKVKILAELYGEPHPSEAVLIDWVTLAGFAEGSVFRKFTPNGRVTVKLMSDRGVGKVVKSHAVAAGYDPEQFAGHSLRAGFLAEAARRGANIF